MAVYMFFIPISASVVSFSFLSSLSLYCHPFLAQIDSFCHFFLDPLTTVFTVVDAIQRKLTLGCKFLSPASQTIPSFECQRSQGCSLHQKKICTSIYRHRSCVGDLYSSLHLLSLIIAVSSSPLYPNVTQLLFSHRMPIADPSVPFCILFLFVELLAPCFTSHNVMVTAWWPEASDKSMGHGSQFLSAFSFFATADFFLNIFLVLECSLLNPTGSIHV